MVEHTKILMAVVGGAAVVAMGGLTTVFDDGMPVTPAVAAPVMPGTMTQGDTVTTTIAPVALPGTVLPTEKAVVTHKAKPYKG